MIDDLIIIEAPLSLVRMDAFGREGLGVRL
jgi:hypothetical protein